MIDNSRGRERRPPFSLGVLRIACRQSPPSCWSATRDDSAATSPPPWQHRNTQHTRMATREAGHGTSAPLEVGVARHPTGAALPVCCAARAVHQQPGRRGRLPSERRCVRIPARSILLPWGLEQKAGWDWVILNGETNFHEVAKPTEQTLISWGGMPQNHICMHQPI